MNAPDPFETAADWLEDVQEWDHARRAAFFDWLAQDTAHLLAARRVTQVMDDPAMVQALAALPAFPANDTAAQDAMPEMPVRAASRHGWLALAASVAVVALGLGVWQSRRPSTPAEDSIHFATRLGQDKASRLSDGSILHLDPATTLDVRMSARARRLHLAQGRALFEVAHAPERPFTVESGAMEVTAIGTVFSVDHSAAGNSLRVEQGRVRVEIEGMTGPIFVGAGQGVMLDKGGVLHRFAFHPDPALAGDPQWLAVDGERLDTLVARLQRHSPAPLSLAPQLAGEAISGRYKSHDPLSSLRLIALAHGWRVVPDGAGWRMAP